jgi:hypothetical protein
MRSFRTLGCLANAREVGYNNRSTMTEILYGISVHDSCTTHGKRPFADEEEVFAILEPVYVP